MPPTSPNTSIQRELFNQIAASDTTIPYFVLIEVRSNFFINPLPAAYVIHSAKPPADVWDEFLHMMGIDEADVVRSRVMQVDSALDGFDE